MIYLILIVSAILRLLGSSQSLWLDEAAQIDESKEPFTGLFDQSIVPHPPLYRILMHYWLMLGRSEWFLRLPSILFGVMSVFVVYKIAQALSEQLKLKKRHKQLFEYGSAIFLALNHYHIYYSQEFRPYSLACLLSLCSTYFLFKRSWRMYSLFSVLLLYTTYFGVFLLLAHIIYTFLFEKAHLKSHLISFIGSSFAFIPYVPFLIKQIQVLAIGMLSEVPGWATAVSVPLYKVLPLTFVKFMLGRITIQPKIFYGILAVVAATVYIYLAIRAFYFSRQMVKRLIILTGVPVIIAFVVSFIIPVIAPQRLIIILPYMLMVFSFGISAISRTQRKVMSAGFIVLSICILVQYYTHPELQREDWRGATEYVEANATPASLALFAFPRPFAPWSYYQKDKIDSLGITEKLVVSDQDILFLRPKIQNKKRIFYFQYLTDLTDPNKKVSEFLKYNGYKEVSIQNFHGVGFIYVFENAKI